MTYCFQKKQLIAVLSFSIFFLFSYVKGEAHANYLSHSLLKDTLPTEVKEVDIDTTIAGNMSHDHFAGIDIDNINVSDTVSIKKVSSQPFVSLQQMLKGEVAGAFVEEPSGEPGTKQYMFIRGLSSALLNKKDLFNTQPAVYINGIPIIRENPFAYNIQQYDFNRIGPATNYMADLNPNDISSIKVIKDPMALAALGPDAVNGAVWITTKNAHSGFREIEVNSYVGFVNKPRVTPVNAAFEDDFREPYYRLYGTIQDKMNYPAYLRDSTNKTYYGNSNWTDLYYRRKPIHSFDVSLTGGSERANFRFMATQARTNGNADGTNLDKYGVSFFINMLPLKWLTVSSMIRANRLERNRNKSIRDRVAEERYLPDLTNPLSPNKAIYSQYLNEFNGVIDDNKVNTIQGYFGIRATLGDLVYNGKLSINYNEGIRDVFWPTTLLEGNNFVSNYFGYDQRFIVKNTLSYKINLNAGSQINLKAGQEIQEDIEKYEYQYGYNGPTDFIKVNLAEGGSLNPNNHTSESNYSGFQFPDKMTPRMASYYFKAGYKVKKNAQVNAIIRTDGSSNAQPNHRWFLSYGANGFLNLKNIFLENSTLDRLDVGLSFARIGKKFSEDHFAIGPQYAVQLGWNGVPTMGSYVGIAGLSRPYNTGWIGYDIPWEYSEKLDLNVKIGFLKNRLLANLDFYKKDDKDLVLPVPIPEIYGYKAAYKSGMWIQNTGIDLAVSAKILENKKGLNWLFTLNVNKNKNTLKALPDGLEEVVIGDRKLKVGHAVDQFWLYKNTGIYKEDAEVPVNPNTNEPRTFNGVIMHKGDAKWVDVNGDYVINSDDKTLQGHFMPKVFGGFGSNFSYGAWSLDFQFLVALGKDVLNKYASDRLDFVNKQKNNTIESVKEITFWEKRVDLKQYPHYNPWSNVIPYRPDQDLFLEDGSYMKLKSLSLGYDLTKAGLLDFSKNGRNVFRRFYVYLSGSNLWTITQFKTDDPELALYNGIFNGHNLPIPSSFTVGVKISL